MPVSNSHRSIALALALSRLIALVVAAAGALVLAGWWLNVRVLQTILPGAVAMKANTALALVLAGLALWLLQAPSADRRWTAVRHGCATLIALIGLLTLSQYLFGWQLGLDELLVRDTASTPGAFPGRSAALTALNFVLVGLAFFAFDPGRRYRLAQGLAIFVGLVALLALLGYLYGAEAFYRLTGRNGMAVHTAVGFFLIALGLLLARPTAGFMTPFTSASAGGLLARRVLPAAIVAPVVLGWLRLQGQLIGLYDTRFGVALFAVSNIILFTGLIAVSARSLFQLDVAREAAELQIKQLNADLEQRVAERTEQLTQANQQLAQEAVERQLAALELSRLKLALDKISDGAQILSPEWRYLYVNGAAASQGHLPAAELIGRTMPEVYPGIEATPLFAAMHRCMDTQAPDHFENQFTYPDGGTGWFDLSLQPMADGLFILSADVTARKQAETALRESEAKLRALFAALPVGISVLDHNRQVVDSNPALERILRLSPDALASGAAGARQFIHPNGVALDVAERPSTRVFETQQPVLDVEMGVVLESSEVVWISVSAVPVPESSLGAVIVTSDITERKRVEAALAQERDLLQALMDNIPDTIYFKDSASRFTRINRALAQVLGLADPAAAYGKTDADFQAAHLAAEFFSEEQQLIQTGVPLIDRQEYNPTLDGQPRWFSATKVPLIDRQGRVQGLIGISHDITHRIQAADGLRTTNEALTERVRQMALLHDLDEHLQACVTGAEAFQVAAGVVDQLFPDEDGALYSASSSGQRVELAAAWGGPAPQAQEFGLDDCWALRRARTYQSGVAQPMHSACRHLPSAPALAVCVPIQAHGEMLGLLSLSAAAGQPAPQFDDSLLQLTQLVSDSLALALANLNLRDKLRQQSIRDPLTNLFNRRYMEESLERELLQAARHGQPVGIIMLDVDHFKQVNDEHGHEAGDAVLRQLGRYLFENMRGGDIACRYGGEEFALIMPAADLAQTRQRAEQHRLAFQAQPLPKGAVAQLSLSLGVAAFPTHGQTGAALLRAADAALYQAKHAGRNRVVVAE